MTNEADQNLKCASFENHSKYTDLQFVLNLHFIMLLKILQKNQELLV